MTNNTGAVLGLAASGTVLAIALAATSDNEPSMLDSAPGCSLVLSERGSFLVPDDIGRCDLLYPPGHHIRCDLSPISDVRHQWSFSGTPLGLVVKGLQRGAVVAFECKE